MVDLMRSYPPKEHESLPRLDPPSGYILVIRDIDGDTFHIASAADPVAPLNDMLAKDERHFGIELLSLMASTNLAASATVLANEHRVRLDSEWRRIDAEQFASMRRSRSNLFSHPSHYLPPPPPPPETPAFKRIADATIGSLPPKAYATLPRLSAPAGYIVVIRDIDSDTFCMNRTQHPHSYVEELFAERPRDFGIELVSILESIDLAHSESQLYEQHHAALSAAWLALDPLQIEALRRSSLQIDAYDSHYMVSKREPLPQATARTEVPPRYQSLVRSNKQGVSTNKETNRRSPIYKPYGTESLRRNQLVNNPRWVYEDEPMNWRQHIGEHFEDLLVNHPGKFMFALAFFLLVLLLFLGGRPNPPYYY